MVTLSLILALAGLASAADTTGFNILQGDVLLPDNVSNLGLDINARDSSCRTSQVTCDSKFCVPTGSECCGRGDGAYCDQGRQCVDNGCCEKGKTCTGPPTKCDSGKVFCGEFCIPQDAVCCHNQGIYCLSGESCTTDGRCKSGSDNKDDANSTSAATSSQAPSSSTSTAPTTVTTTTKAPSSSLSSSSPSSSSDKHSTTSDTTTSVAPVTTNKVTSEKSTTTAAATSDVPATTEQVVSSNSPVVTSSPSTHQAPSGEVTTIHETITGDSDATTEASSEAASSSDTFVGQTTLAASHVTATTTVLPSESQPTDFTTGDNKDGAGFAHRPSLLLGLLALLPWVL